MLIRKCLSNSCTVTSEHHSVINIQYPRTAHNGTIFWVLFYLLFLSSPFLRLVILLYTIRTLFKLKYSFYLCVLSKVFYNRVYYIITVSSFINQIQKTNLIGTEFILKFKLLYGVSNQSKSWVRKKIEIACLSRCSLVV